MPGDYKKIADKLQLLYQISLQFSSTLNLDDVLGKILSLTVSTLGASKGSIFFLDDQGQVVRKILARGDLPPEDSRMVVVKVMDKGLAGWVYKHRQPAVIPDTVQDDRWVTFLDDTTAPRSALSVPLMRGERVVGLLTLVHPEADFFSDEDLDLAVAIGGMAAVAVENARLFTQANAERRTLSAVLRNVRAAIIVTNQEQEVLLINPPAAAIFNTSNQQAEGQLLKHVIQNPSLVDLFDRGHPNMPSPISGEVHASNGSTHNATLSPVPGVGYAVVLHDITFLKRLDELKTESMAAVSHDLRGPLGIILGAAEMMVQYTDVGDEQKEFIELITMTADRMQNLVECLLDLSRLESGQELQWEIAPVQVMLDKIIREAHAQAQLKGVSMEEQFADNLPDLRADPLQLGQAVANLLNNAIKYTPAGGRVTLVVDMDTAQSEMLIKITDTGPGIPPEAMENLFEKFFRVGSLETVEKEGAGLGLAIVRSVVQAHNGRVWVESKWGHGACFIIALPADLKGET